MPAKPFEPGNKFSKGRKPGSRNRLNLKFLTALEKAFDDYGDEVFRIVRAENPEALMKIWAGLLPREEVLDANSNITVRTIITGVPRDEQYGKAKQVAGPVIDALPAPPPVIEKRVTAPSVPVDKPKPEGRTLRIGNETFRGWNGELGPAVIEYPDTGKI